MRTEMSPRTCGLSRLVRPACRGDTGPTHLAGNQTMLLSATQSLAFLAAAMLITVSPGPDNLMVLSLGASRGRKPGMVFGLGCALGCLNHTLLAALGVSALIAASPLAFTA